ncbi:NLI-interacting factor, putative [Bodo saltans]|uniref:Mitochondrial import inner membrane translocase subunit TIM50 n=1 Tax=Bodo saltans TaxID=75058 RepID=A0A0S4JJI6_BODSA|nr:NLI-interacting factor, putative [Bodo saltans]|eukprot:CUG89563.1 NLI-interacting factor, putative [Bodo saltans]
MVLATGLARDHDPHWPLPLPPPLIKLEIDAKKKHTLVLDIDETLLHTVHQERHPQVRHLDNYHVLLRPHVGTFLKEVHELFEVVLWTAGVATYGGAMANVLEQAAGLEKSNYYDAEVLWASLDPTKKDTAEVADNDNVNWYLLSRAQTLTSHNWMKYIPMLGRDEKSVIMIDDNVRSFPLTPRGGVKIGAFDPRENILGSYFGLMQELEVPPERFPHLLDDSAALGEPSVEFYAKHFSRGDNAKAHAIFHGVKEIKRLESDRALLDLLPMLRAVASAETAVGEMDHWRSDDYIMCDNFMENMRNETAARSAVLGTFLPQRRTSGPIPALKQAVHNYPLVQEAKQNMHELWGHSKRQQEGKTRSRSQPRISTKSNL